MQQCDAEFVNALDTALAECADQGYVFSDLPKKTDGDRTLHERCA